jgi:hypothetical protein
LNRFDKSLKGYQAKGSVRLTTVVNLEALIDEVIPAAFKPSETKIENIMRSTINMIIYRIGVRNEIKSVHFKYTSLNL